MSVIVGHAFFFERIVVYGGVEDLISLFRSKRMRSKAGEFLGAVKGLIPRDPSRVLYEYHKHTEAFKKRMKFRAWKKKRGITRLTLKRNRKLTEWI